MGVPTPGSHAAIKMGCKCNMLVNQLGLGAGMSGSIRNFVIDEACDLHRGVESYDLPPRPRMKEQPRIVKTKGQIMVEGAIRRVTKVMFHADDRGRHGK